MSYLNEKEFLEIKNVIRSMFSFYGSSNNEQRILAYSEKLKNYSFNQLKAACEKAVDECKFTPAISDLIGYLRTGDVTREENILVETSNFLTEQQRTNVLSKISTSFADGTLGNFNKRMTEMKHPNCKFCQGDGMVNAKDKNNFSFVFNCFCSSSDKRRPYPTWKIGLESKYKPNYL